MARSQEVMEHRDEGDPTQVTFLDKIKRNHGGVEVECWEQRMRMMPRL